ncbi:restriction endonuclease subunit S [Proteus penneri]|uniref:restriction endonuclease subunit S n=1 Tax=Proteus penneri TaxID=102862 RepID=UPI000D6E961E|nr:restriction endonuclease subunit S [Proteus penneri]QPT33057.1 restriction endonuclease subunit S [Proteus penneri]
MNEFTEWKTLQFKDICRLKSDKVTVDSSDIQTYISTENMLPNFGGVQSAKNIPLTGKLNTFKYGDVLFSNIRTYFKKVWIATFDGVASPDVLIFSAMKNCEPQYLYYMMCEPQFTEFTVLTSRGAKMPRGDKEAILNYEISLPSLAEQKAIASILASLDNKIDLLHRQNKTLESIAETLFRQCFVDDSNGSGTEVELHEIIEFNPKRVLSKGSKAMYLEMAGLNTNTFAASGYYERDFTSGQKFIKQDTLLARITPCLENGKAGYVHFLSPEQVGWGSTEFIVLRPKPKFHPLFSYILCRNNEFKEYAESCMEGSSGRQRVNVSHLSMYTLTLPHDDVITQFNEILASIEPKLISNALQIQTLENLRDTLLPKLMSGEVRVNYTPEEIKQ